VRKDMRHILQASALGVSGAVALAVAVGMAAGSVTWTLALWMPFGAALGITAVLTAVAGVVLSVMARARLPGGDKAKAEDEKAALEEPAARRALRTAHHDAEAPT
jgi:cobalamin synthase